MSNLKSDKKTHHTLRESGLRATSSRALILEIIRQRKGHLDADDIYRRARKKLPHLSLATVYRNLRHFKELGFINQLHFDENHHHYEIKPSTEHHHLVCLGCNRIVEFDYPLPHHIIRDIAEARGFKVTKSEMQLSGYCPQCQQKGKVAINR